MLLDHALFLGLCCPVHSHTWLRAKEACITSQTEQTTAGLATQGVSKMWEPQKTSVLHATAASLEWESQMVHLIQRPWRFADLTETHGLLVLIKFNQLSSNLHSYDNCCLQWWFRRMKVRDDNGTAVWNPGDFVYLSWTKNGREAAHHLQRVERGKNIHIVIRQIIWRTKRSHMVEEKIST